MCIAIHDVSFQNVLVAAILRTNDSEFAARCRAPSFAPKEELFESRRQTKTWKTVSTQMGKIWKNATRKTANKKIRQKADPTVQSV